MIINLKKDILEEMWLGHCSTCHINRIDPRGTYSCVSLSQDDILNEFHDIIMGLPMSVRKQFKLRVDVKACEKHLHKVVGRRSRKGKVKKLMQTGRELGLWTIK
jgi:hypothetical protein